MTREQVALLATDMQNLPTRTRNALIMDGVLAGRVVDGRRRFYRQRADRWDGHD